MNKIFIFLFLCTCVLLADLASDLNDFDKNFAKSNKKEFYHAKLKSHYVESVIKEDEKMQAEILTRLLVSSKALKLDDSLYVAELKALNAYDRNTPKNTNKDNDKKNIFVLSSKKSTNSVTVFFNKGIDADDLKITELKERGNYRKIIDFKASLDGGRKNYDFDDVKISIAQFNPQTTRIVLSSKDELKSEINIKQKSLEFSFDSLKTKAQKKEKPTQTNNQIYILKSLKEDKGIRLILSDEISKKDIDDYLMKDKDVYRLVLNFKAVLEGSRKNFTFDKNNNISLTQYTPKIARIVLNSNKKIEADIQIEGKELFIGFDKLNLNSTKSAKTNTKTTIAKEEKETKKQVITGNKIVVIDPGHGGKDGGAIGDNGKLLEKNIVLSLSLKIGQELKKRGYKVYYTRTKDRFINLRDRTKIANEKRASMFISIHANASPNKKRASSMQGIETFFLSPARSERSKEVAEKENKSDLEEANYFSKQNFLHSLSREKIIASNRLAIDIQKYTLSSVRKRYKVEDGGVREAPFWVLVGAQDMPAVLVEIGYITHPSEGKRLATKAYQDLVAEGIANGIQNYFYNNQ